MSKRICIFGDSITRGYYDNKGEGWANRLKKYFENKNSDNSVYNLGIAGDTTKDLLERIDIEAKARNPEIIIFGIGINDSVYIKSSNGNYVPIKSFIKNLEVLKQEANVFTEKIIFVGLTKVDEKKTSPIPWGKYFYYKNKNVKEYDQAIKDFCIKNNLPFIEMYDLLSKEDLEDGLHPNSAGHEKIFQRVKDFLIANKII